MIKKTKLISFASAVMLLSACSSEPVVLEQDEYTEISLSWWGNDSRIEYTLDAVKTFEKLHPEIRVKCSYSEWSGYQTRYKIQMASGTESDVMLINFAWLDEYSEDGSGYYDISTLGNTLDLSQFCGNELSFGKRNGKLNAVPIALNAQTVYFNKTVYDSYGLDIPQTWDQLFSASKVMDDDVYPVSMSSKSAFFYITAYTEQKTGKRFMTDDGRLNFTKEDISLMLKFYSELINSHVMPQVEYYDKNCIRNGTYAGTVAWLSDAKNYMSPAEEAGYEITVGEYTTLSEKGDGWYTKPATMYAVSKNTEHPDESALLLDFLLNSDEMSNLQGIEKGIPLSRKSRNYLEENDMLNGIQYDAFIRMNEHLDGMALIDPFMENSEMIDAFQDGCNAVLFDKISAEDKAAELYDLFTEMLDK